MERIVFAAFKLKDRDFAGGSVVKNPPANAGDIHEFSAWSRKIPHVAEQRCPSTTTTEAHALESTTRKAAPVSSPQTATRE